MQSVLCTDCTAPVHIAQVASASGQSRCLAWLWRHSFCLSEPLWGQIKPHRNRLSVCLPDIVAAAGQTADPSSCSDCIPAVPTFNQYILHALVRGAVLLWARIRRRSNCRQARYHTGDVAASLDAYIWLGGYAFLWPTQLLRSATPVALGVHHLQ